VVRRSDERTDGVAFTVEDGIGTSSTPSTATAERPSGPRCRCTDAVETFTLEASPRRVDRLEVGAGMNNIDLGGAPLAVYAAPDVRRR
jgi:hypothetical protein